MGIRRLPVTIELDGKERSLKFDLNALCLFEEQAKTSLRSALADLSMTSVRTLVWAGLLHEDPLLTVQDVGKMEFVSLRDVSEKVVKALNGDTASADREARPIAAPVTIPALTGIRSGASDDSISVLASANSGD